MSIGSSHARIRLAKTLMSWRYLEASSVLGGGFSVKESIFFFSGACFRVWRVWGFGSGMCVVLCVGWESVSKGAELLKGLKWSYVGGR